MEFRFGEREERLRAEVRAFLHEQLPSDWDRYVVELGVRDEREAELADRINRALAARGWLAPAWPVEHGGLGASIYEQMVFAEELGYVGAPDVGSRDGAVNLLGPTIMIHGNDEQKRRYLPRIVRAEDHWCQGYSEPGSGSDLASLTTAARRDGDEYVISGQKIWTSGGHHANQMFCLVRTDPSAPKHRGITFIIIDDIQRQPGLTIRPLIDMAKRHHVNEVFFDEVRVPATNVIGAENRGWYVAMTLLEFERSGIGRTASCKRAIERLAAYVREAGIRSQQRFGLADLATANEILRLLGYRIGHVQTLGQPLSYEPSIVKVLQSELTQRIFELGIRILGLHGLLPPWEPRAPLGGNVAESHLQAVPATIYAGANEIQRNVTATRGLGLPRS
jgi:alkylation response protein AidB-like acyl-CoA dehydrogenase